MFAVGESEIQPGLPLRSSASGQPLCTIAAELLLPAEALALLGAAAAASMAAAAKKAVAGTSHMSTARIAGGDPVPPALSAAAVLGLQSALTPPTMHVATTSAIAW